MEMPEADTLSSEDLVQKCLNRPLALKKWEMGFLEDVKTNVDRLVEISPGQRAKLVEIYNSVYGM